VRAAQSKVVGAVKAGIVASWERSGYNQVRADGGSGFDFCTGKQAWLAKSGKSCILLV